MIKIITEVLELISYLAQQHMEKLGIKAWKIALGLGLALVSTLLILVSICFFGCSVYHRIEEMLGASTAAMVAGSFFMLVSIILLLISQKLIKKK